MTLIEDMEKKDPPSKAAFVWFLGGSSVAVKFHRQPLVFIDLDAGKNDFDQPPLGRAPGFKLRRTVTLPFDIADISAPAAYVSTHEHLDHCEQKASLSVVSKGGVFIGPRSACENARKWRISAERIWPMDGNRYEKKEYGDVLIYAAPGRDPNADASNIVVVCYDNICILHNGDSLYDGPNYLEISDKFTIDAAIINLGKNPKGRHWYHTPYDVARAANDMSPKVIIPHHYDKWDKIREDPLTIKRAMDASYPEVSASTRLVILNPAERYEITK
ncbi:MAG: MBL fold metallo-hydrolase [Nitrososphaerota archaeon]|nr:MBL fold metallo-hydrolase [Nitrososphaerota archaeon]